jgi:hypothetical protein
MCNEDGWEVMGDYGTRREGSERQREMSPGMVLD